MKKMISVAVMAAAALACSAASARNDMLKLPIEGAMVANDAQDRLSGSVKFFFAGQPTPEVESKIITDRQASAPTASASRQRRHAIMYSCPPCCN